MKLLSRNPEQLCLLCFNRKASKTNSHFVSRGLVESVFGKSDLEEVYTIKPGERKALELYYGRSNLKNSNTEFQDNNQTADFIFCQECETKLSEIESTSIKILCKELLDVKFKAKFQFHKTSNSNIVAVDFPKNLQNTIRTFVVSNIWRFALLWRFRLGRDIIGIDEVEDLRRELYSFTENQSLEFKPMNLRVIVCNEIYNPTSDAVFYNPEARHPYLIFLGAWIIFFDDGFKNFDWSRKFNEEEVIIPKEINSSLNEFKCGLIPLKEREVLYQELHYTIARETVEPRAINLAIKYRTNPYHAKEILNREAERISKEKNIEFGPAFLEAYDSLISI